MKDKKRSNIESNRKITALWAGLSFFLPCAVISVILAANGVTPFGNETIITESGLDWFENFCRMYKSIVSGNSVFYNLDVGFGRSFYSEFASGLCSPFFFAALFFPSDKLAAAYSVITILRAGLAGLFAWFMLSKCTGIAKPLSFALACGYALCGFTSCAAYYPSIADAAVFFPLVMIGIYTYVTEGRPIRLFLFAFLLFITCARLFIGVTVVCIMIYFAFYYGNKSTDMPLYKFAMFSATLLCSAGAAAVLIIPMGAGAAYYKGGIFPRVDGVDFAGALCFGGYATECEEGGCYICIAGLLIMGTAAFMLNKCIDLRERIFTGAASALIMLASVIPAIGRVMFGFCAFTDEKTNIGFAFAAIAVYCTARNFAESDGIRLLTAGISAGVFVLICVVSIALRGAEVFAVLAESGLAVVFIAIFITLSYDRHSIPLRLSAVTAGALALFGAIHCGAAIGGINSPYLSDAIASDTTEKLRINQMISDNEQAMGSSMRFFRYRSVDGTADGAGLTHNQTAGMEEFAKRLGIMPGAKFGGGENFTPLTDIIFGTGYVISGGEVHAADDPVQSPAYTVNGLDDGFIDGGSAFDVQNRISAGWFGVENLFTPADFVLEESTNSAESERYKWVFDNESTWVNKYEIRLNEGDSLFLLVRSGDYSYAVGQDNRSNWHYGCEGGIYTLFDGAQKSEGGELEIYISADGIPSDGGISDPELMIISERARKDLVNCASEHGAQYISHRGSSVNFMLSAGEGQIAVTSIPYEYGWEITNNGHKVEAFEICGGLIGIGLENGTNSIVMRYTPPFFKLSMILSCALFLLGMYVALRTEHDIARRRKVRMAFRAVELNKIKNMDVNS